eukprot:g6223.t1
MLTLHSNFLTSSSSILKETRFDRLMPVNASDRSEDEGGIVIPEDYLEAQIDGVTDQDDCGVLTLRLKEAQDTVLIMYIGKFECQQLLAFIKEKEMTRPMTYEFMRNSFKSLGVHVTQIRVTALVGHSYHARVFYKTRDTDDVISVDARPSDAINLAVRFNVPLFIHKEVAYRMGNSTDRPRQRSPLEVVRSCREEIAKHHDPTVILKLQMEMAVAQEKYATAAQLRDEIDKVLASDRALGLVVALESALSGGRYDEAVQIRDKLRDLRRSRGGSEKYTSH